MRNTNQHPIVFWICIIALFALIASACQAPIPGTKVYNIRDYRVEEVTFDNCQYLMSNQYFTHKGNCNNPVHYTKRSIYGYRIILGDSIYVYQGDRRVGAVPNGTSAIDSLFWKDNE